MMCKVDEICEIQDILQAYFNLWDEKHQVIRPEVIVDKEPNQDLMDEIQNIITKKYPGKEIHMNVTVDPELMGGYVIRVGQEEWDRSYEGYLKQLEMKLSRR